ncbi:MAG: S8 family serine peptidase, partial [Bacillota bacterium]|nr:S8 family serine peptidase [Bacillota bacterium]
MKKFLCIVFVLLLVFSCVPVSAAEQNDNPTTVDSSNNNQISDASETENEIISNATIDDDFEPDSVVVVLKNSESKKLKSFVNKDFNEISPASVNDLTNYSKDAIQKQRNVANKHLDIHKLNKKQLEEFGIATTNEANPVIIDESKFHQFLEIKLPTKSKENVIKVIKKIEKRDDVLIAEPSYIFKSDATVTPNDPKYTNGDQWAINRISLPSAWGNFTTGSSSVNVGVLDSGIDGTHNDLKNRINTDLSYDFTGGNSPLTDQHGHGTHVAGIIGAQGNNNTGITGVCWDVRLVSLKAAVPDGKGGATMSSPRFESALEYAETHGIPIVNCSYGIWGDAEKQKIQEYSGLLALSAGNNAEFTTYPSLYNLSNVITVAATKKNNDDLADANDWGYDGSGNPLGSNWNETYVDLAAPGTDIWSALPGNTYGCWDGTSMATPFVTGVAALILSNLPNNSIMNGDGLRLAITDNVDKVSALSGYVSTGGRLNAAKAVNSNYWRKYTVQYYANGGSGSTMANTTVTYGVPTPLRKNTYEIPNKHFCGWNVQRASDGKWHTNNGWNTQAEIDGSGGTIQKSVYTDGGNISETTNENGAVLNFIATWSINTYSISYDKNGGTGYIQANMNIEVGKGVTLSTGTSFTKTNVHFDHWLAYMINADQKKEWHYSNGTGNAGWYLEGEQPTGYTMDTYSDKAFVTFSPPENYDTVYMQAQWAPNTVTIQYDSNGGTGTMANTTITYGATTTCIQQNNFSKTGQVGFACWNFRNSQGEYLYYEIHAEYVQWLYPSQVESLSGSFNLFRFTNKTDSSLLWKAIGDSGTGDGDTLTAVAEWGDIIGTPSCNILGGTTASASITCSVQATNPTNTYQSPMVNPSGLTYQWQRSSDKITWTDISGANAPSYTPNTEDSGYYVRYEAVSNGLSLPCGAFNSNPAIIIAHLGDVYYLDGIVNLKDATLTQKSIAQMVTLNDKQKCAADVNLDGIVNLKDVTSIQKWLVGISTQLKINQMVVYGGTINSVTPATSGVSVSMDSIATPQSDQSYATINGKQANVGDEVTYTAYLKNPGDMAGLNSELDYSTTNLQLESVNADTLNPDFIN